MKVEYHSDKAAKELLTKLEDAKTPKEKLTLIEEALIHAFAMGWECND